MLDPQRQGEIALLVVKHLLRRRGVTLSHDYVRELGNRAKEIGIPVAELKEFLKPLVTEVLEECLGTK